MDTVINMHAFADYVKTLRTDSQWEEFLGTTGLAGERDNRSIRESIDALRAVLPKNRHGNTVEDVYCRLSWLTSLAAPKGKAPGLRWDAILREYPWKRIDDDWFNTLVIEGFVVRPDADWWKSLRTWGDLCMAVWRHCAQPLAPVSADSQEGMTRGLVVGIMKELSSRAEVDEDKVVTEIIPRRQLVRLYARLLVALGHTGGLSVKPATAVGAALVAFGMVPLAFIGGSLLFTAFVGRILGILIWIGAAAVVWVSGEWRKFWQWYGSLLGRVAKSADISAALRAFDKVTIRDLCGRFQART